MPDTNARPWLRRPSRHVTVAVGATVLVLGAVLWQRCGIRGCPEVDRLAAYQPGGAPVLLDRHGEPFADLAPVERVVVPLGPLPSYVPEAFVAVEDRRFREHRGVDWRRVPGAAIADVRAGGFAQGFSTITMQLARNLFPDRLPAAQRTVRRKLLEIRVAGDIERRFTKDQILELYLNHIYFGEGVYGIESAARHYFGESAEDLALAQAATLAAMPKAPNSYDPREHPERTRERRDLVLSLMEAQGRIDAAEAERARSRPVRTVRRPRPSEPESELGPYFVQAVRRQLEAQLGDGLYSEPLRVYTTFDPAAQRASERALVRHLDAIESGRFGRYDGARHGSEGALTDAATLHIQGAVVVLDADSGDVLALVGGREYRESPFDRATLARRQVGSAFKPFVFAAAIQEGYAPSQRLSDEPLRLELPGGEVYEPRNFGGRYAGEVTLRRTAVESRNVPTVRLALAVGLDDVAAAARRAGLRSDLPELPSLALGASQHTLLEVAGAYSAFAAGGRAAEPRLVRRVEDPDGGIVWEAKPTRRRAFDPAVAYLVTDLLGEALEQGTGRRAREGGYRGPAAGKTGTTDDGADVWFVGYTPDLVAAVWLGFDRPRAIVEGASAGELAAPLWGRIARELYRERPTPDPWPRPEEIVERPVDPGSGLVLEEGCRPAAGQAGAELFIEGQEPARVCPEGGEEGPSFLARLGGAVAGLWTRGRGWVASLFRDEEEDRRERERQERYLGARPLPKAREPAPPEDTTPPKLLGVPLDSLHLLDPDSARAQGLPVPETLRLAPPPEGGRGRGRDRDRPPGRRRGSG